MIRNLIKLIAYSRAPKTTFSVLHPVMAAQLVKTPFDLRTAYAPRLTAVATALLVAPLAYGIGRMSAERRRTRSGMSAGEALGGAEAGVPV